MKTRVDKVLRLGAGGFLLAVPAMASALQFDWGEVKGSLDTTLSAGVQVRLQDQDDRLVAIANGGTSRSPNDDDGNLNFDRGDVTSAPIKATHDLELKRGNYGVFTRVSYFYDIENHDSNNLGERGEDRLGAELDLLDLFAYGSFDVVGRRVDLRVGKQVVNWGESTFITNGINSVNPVDVGKLRQPGSEIKEALLPTPAVWSAISLTDSIGLELLWLAAYDKTEIDPMGSYFSTSDVVSDDAMRAFGGGGRRFDDRSPPATLAGPGASPMAQLWVQRLPDRNPDDTHDQHGAALRWLAPQALNSTEFGLFYLNYHSRTPFVSGRRGGPAGGGPGGFPTPLGLFNNQPGSAGSGFYFVEYPEDIELYGLSFNTSGPFGVALQGEYSYRPNQPLQLEDVELLLAGVGLPNNITGSGFTAIPDGPDANTDPDIVPSAALVPAGTPLQGYRRVKMHQVQMTGTKAFGPTLRAQQFTLLGEVGYTHLELPNGVLFNGPGTNLPSSQVSANAVNQGSTQKGAGYATNSSWGYRAVARMDYENLIGAVGVSPRLVFSHDVNGVSPTFNKDAQALTFGIGFNYLQRWQGDLAYTNFFGGRTYSGVDPLPVPAGQSAGYATSANPLKDRDFLSASISYAF
ncbi:MAG TPA: DUF1302 domain-containing protein [Solimonas sp.]|nr:DUF1302 domain-containing protein [Solimonas sp.]